ncbi:MAG: hypothetical protein JWO86_8338 [Myxococcaceae bacterium]|nr:hypothetical protein [Myxococcaceae bacterium]
MTRVRSAALLLAGMLASVTVTTAARAQSGTALSLFNEGRALASQGRYEEACDRFARSDALEHKVGTLLNLGDCNEHLKKFASAWVADSQAEALARRLNDPRAKDAHEAAARVEPLYARLVIVVEATYPGLVVKRNDTKVEAAEFNATIPVDPGPQTITVNATGRTPWQTNVRLAEGESHTIRVPALEPVPGGAADTSPPPVVPENGSSRSTVALGLEIGGGVVLAGGLLFGAFALSTWSSVTSACPNARCPNEAQRAAHASDVSRASTFGVVSTIGVAVGGAALITGIVLHLTAPGKSVSLAPTFDHAGGGLVATLRL